MFKLKKSPPNSPSPSMASFYTAPQSSPENAVSVGIASAAHVSRTLAMAASETPLPSSSASASRTSPSKGSANLHRGSVSAPPLRDSSDTVFGPSITDVSLSPNKPLIKSTRTAPWNFNYMSPPSSPSKSSSSSPYKSSSSSPSRSSPLSLSHSPSHDVHHVKYAHGAISTVAVREEWTVHGKGGMTASAILNKPSTSAEHYWAARALTAESILEAKMDHQQELKSIKLYEDEKRTRDLAVLQQAHDAQYKELKRTLFFTITCIVVLLAFIIYILMTNSPASKQSASRWGAHFTIPILSPFTSVIEHEVSTFGTTALIGFAFVFAGLAYAVFRYYAGRRST
ncbi:uncharacterized protein STEHIDRAFT_139125 [Stereum hirsutum FP-91666 SS1]|uniref:uncharacterized protein n=1 Tax=Stereum hirsutum (strain FP-91666) TaxID=721885 RepID=UPI000440F56B|nr:uncharacterized protein STEHIDRAFT_139125 [Stereum hirsutum FP-91666 SS1]EIM87453.1 hypothetical protein STEHIDRAFT_139125 [Stereum hirsutum FP-91666 SS1]